MRVTGSIIIKKPRPPIYRVLHDKELRKVMAETGIPYSALPDRVDPQVHPFFPNHHSPFDRAWQLLSRALNPKISDGKWRTVYWYKLWITNHQGFDKEGDPRADFVSNRDLGAEYPRVEALTTGGSVITGRMEGDVFVVQGLNIWGATPSTQYMWDNPWYLTYATSRDANGNVRRFPQGLQPDGSIVPIVHPLIVDARRYPRITLPGWKVELWREKELPDPYTFYRL